MAASDEKAIAVLQKATYDNDNDESAARDVVHNIRATLLMNPVCKWEDLLGSAPSAIYSLGCCYIVSSAEEAEKITLDITNCSLLKYTSLRANLVGAGDMGRRAFRQADTGMDIIHMQSAHVDTYIRKVAHHITNPETGRHELIPTMKGIMRAAEVCGAASAQIEREFDNWLTFLSELHQACEDKRTKTSKDLDDTKQEITARKTIEETQKELVHEAKKDIKLWKKKMDFMEKKYQQACDAYPSSWDVFAQESMRNLLNVASAAAQGYLSMSTGGIFAAMVGAGTAQGNAAEPVGEKAPGSTAPPVQNPMKELFESHCHAAIGVDMSYIKVLEAFIIGGNTGTFDWEKMKTELENLKGACRMLKIAGDEYPNPEGNSIDQKYQALIKSVAEVASWLLSELEKAAVMNWTPPEPTDPKAVSMVQKLRTSTAEMQKIQSMVLSLGGNATADLPMAGDKPTTGTGSISYLAASQQRLEATQAGLKSASELYSHSVQALAEKKKRLAETEAMLAQLSQQKLSLEEIKKILLKSIQIIKDLKLQLQTLNGFFTKLNVMIQAALQGPITDFLASVTSQVTGGKTDDINNVSMGDFDMVSFRQTSVFHHIVNIRAYYTVFADISAMWLQLSKESLIGGLDMCTELSTMTNSGPDALATKGRDLQSWASKARENVIRIATASQDEISGHLEKRVRKIEKVARQLTPTESRKALEEGSKDANKTIKKHIDHASNPTDLHHGLGL